MMTQRVGRLAMAALLASGVVVSAAGAADPYDAGAPAGDRYDQRRMDERYDQRGADQGYDHRAMDERSADRTASRERIAPLDTTVRVEDVRTTDDEVSGRIVNESDDQLDDVRLLVSDQFLWKNERHPGAQSPSDAHTVTVAGPIPPHGEKTFRFRRPSPLPDRRDGQFVTDVTALQVTRRPVMARGPYDETYQSRGYDRRSEPQYDHPYRYDDDRYRYDDRYDDR